MQLSSTTSNLQFNSSVSLIWDFDGTIADSFLAIREAWINVCSHNNLPIPTDELILSLMGVPLELIAQKLNSTNSVPNQKLVDEYKVEFENHVKLIQSFEGIEEVLIELFKARIPMFVVSARTSSSLNQLLNNLGLKNFFQKIIGAEDVINAKPDKEAVDIIIAEFSLNRQKVTVIGDAEVDLDMANNAEVKSILVTWGSLTLDKITDLGIQPNYIIKNPNEIKLILTQGACK